MRIALLKAHAKLTLLIMWIGLCCLPCWLAKKLHKHAAHARIILLCYKGILRIIGLRLTVRGELASERPLLLVSNHVSYLDIMILGSAAPVRFTPKSDVEKWPVIGWICKLCDAIFVERRSSGIQQVKEALTHAFAGGNVVSLFPEATTGDGVHMQRFKSGFFSLAEIATVQPAAITYTRISRLPIDRTQWPHIAWYGDMTLLPHLLNVLSLGPIDAELIFLPPVTMAGFEDRKALAAHCQQEITTAIEAVRAHIPSASHRKCLPKVARFLRK